MPRRQRLAAWLTCLTVATCSVGVPLPARSQRHSAGAPYPCQNCPCGCTDAETCWRNCCCHSNVEKLAWARRHRVKPPAYVIAAARREQRKAECQLACCRSKRAVGSAAATPCAKCSRGAPCNPAEQLGKADSKSARCARCGAAKVSVVAAGAEQPRTPARSAGIVLLAAKLRCGGISLSVSLLPPSIVTPPSLFACAPPAQFQRWPGASLLYESPYLAITPPPPDMPAV